MALPREDVTTGLLRELAAFEALIRPLTPEEWAAPSRCAGWSTADVAAHVVGQMTDVTTGRLEGLGTAEVTARQVAERRGRSPVELADELAASSKVTGDMLAGFDDALWAMPSPGGFDFTLGEGVEALWYDAYLHGDDIRMAVGQPSERGDGLTASVSHLAGVLGRQGWGPARLALDGSPEFSVADGGEGDVRRVTGDPLTFVLVASGRADPTSLGLDATVNVYR
jgi:uncharacterized protein (TIGR03083 family)